ncbi:MAG: hypothetical protein ACRDSH_24320 [Pseudonocardiaceae bacterium]
MIQIGKSQIEKTQIGKTQIGKSRPRPMRAPVPVLALVAGLVALFSIGINFGEATVGRAGAPPREHGGHGVSDDDQGTGPGGLAIASQGYVLRPRTTLFTAGEYESLRFNIFGKDGKPLTDFARVGDRQMNLIVVRRDLTGYQHLYPVMDPDGTWTAPLELDAPGSYHAFVVFLPGTAKKPVTLGMELSAPGLVELGPISKVSTIADAPDGYSVIRTGELVAGSVSRVWMHVIRDNLPVSDLDPLLGGAGHLVVLREGDLAYVSAQPVAGPRQDTAIDFDVAVPTAGYYRMILEFQHHGQLRTVEFTALAR